MVCEGAEHKRDHTYQNISVWCWRSMLTLVIVIFCCGLRYFYAHYINFNALSTDRVDRNDKGYLVRGIFLTQMADLD